jgi:hypothetical protein
MGQSPVQGVLSNCLKGFVVSEVDSEEELARGPNLRNEQQRTTEYHYRPTNKLVTDDNN